MPAPVGDITLDGKPRSVSGGCPTVTFTVGGRTVFTTRDTDYKKGKCGDLSKDNKEVEVNGTLMSDGRVRAERVTFSKED